MRRTSRTAALALAVTLQCLPFVFVTSALAEDPAKEGRRIAVRMCSGCHAIGSAGRSPHPGAPLFRRLGEIADLDTIRERLRQGLFSGHRDMPEFRMSRQDARALQIYLRNIQIR